MVGESDSVGSCVDRPYFRLVEQLQDRKPREMKSCDNIG